MATQPKAKERRDWRQEVTDTIVDMMERGVAPWQKPWDDKAAAHALQMPHNGVTGRPYTGGNALYLMAQGSALGYDDPRWMTYNQSQEKGWQVRKGERGTQIEFWQFDRVEKVKGEDGKWREERVKLDPPMQRLYTVFNAQQMDGVPAIQPPKREEWQIIKNSGASIRHEGTAAYYSPGSDSITMPPKSSFPSEVDYYGTALHELGHWTGHESRLNRDGITKFDGFGSTQYAKEELRAEMASVFMQAEIGLPHDTERHASYLDGWLETLKKDKNELFRAARDASKISDYVMELDREKELSNVLPQGLTDLEMAAQQAIKSSQLGAPLNPDDHEYFHHDGERHMVEQIAPGAYRIHDSQGNVQEFVPDPEKVQLLSLSGRSLRFNSTPGIAGLEIVNPDNSSLGFGGKEALERFIVEENISPKDAAIMRAIDAKAYGLDGLEKNNVPQVGTPAHAAMLRQSIHDRNATGDYHVLHAKVREEIGDSVNFGRLASDDPIKGKVIAETQHSIALEISPGQAVGLYKMDLKALPKPGQQVSIGALSEQGREVALDRMIEQAHEKTQARHGEYNSTALRPDESQALMQGAEQWEVQKQAEKLNPADKAKLMAKSNTQMAQATTKKQELDSAPREKAYIENIKDHAAIAAVARDGKTVALPELNAVAYVDKVSGDLTLKAPTAAALQALQENSAPTKADSMSFDNSTGDAAGLAADALRRMGAEPQNIEKVMGLAMTPEQRQAKLKESVEILQYDAKELLGNNAKTHTAQTAEGNYKGPIVGQTAYHVMQQVSATQTVAHDKSTFNGQVPQPGQHVHVKYDQGRATAAQVAQTKARPKEKAMER